MFDNITNSLNKVFDKISGKRFISEDDLNSAMREIRIALLEADVSLPIAKDFIAKVKQEAIGRQVIKNIEAGQMIVKIVHDQMVDLLGTEKSDLNLDTKPPLVIMMVGLQGAGKTTTCGKLSHYLSQKHNKKRILLSSLDVQRPAAQEQLAILAEKTNADSLEIIANQNAVEITKRAIKKGEEYNYDVVILDTAGRIHLDDELMQEVSDVKTVANPDEVILVVDAMMGQDAVNVANDFQEKLGLTGIILTRIDGDSRGGAAITMRMATGCPIKFLGSGEKFDELEQFDPERIASRILGMGDVVSLVEKASEVFGKEELEKTEKKLKKGQFDLNDLASQLKNMKKMGGMGGILKFLPGGGKLKDQLGNKNVEKDLAKQEALIMSMTKLERSKPDVLNSSRKRRIALGAGSNIQEVNRLLKRLKQMQKMVKKVGKMDRGSLEDMVGDIDMGNMPKF
jgi:signal recognition particle subunit SRP54